MSDEGDHVEDQVDDGEVDEEEDSELLARVTALEESNSKLLATIEKLTERIDTLEEGSGGDHVEAKKNDKSKKKGESKKKKDKAKAPKKDTKKKADSKKKKLENKGEKKASRVRDRVKEDFYHVGGKKIYVSVPEPYKFGAKVDKPARALKLNYAFGYNGGQNGVFGNLLAYKEELVYCLAGVAVIFNVSDLENPTQRFFNGHCEDVVSIAQNPETPNIFATGQRDPKDGIGEEDKPYTCIWDLEKSEGNPEEIKRIRYGERAVASVGFTFDGKYIFVIGDDDSKTGAWFDWQDDHKKPKFTAMCSKDVIRGQVHAHALTEAEEYTWLTFGNKTMKWWHWKAGQPKGDYPKATSPNSFSETKITQKSFHCAAFTESMDLLVGCESGHIYLFNGNSRKLTKHFDTGKSPVVSLKWGEFKECDDAKYRAVTASGLILYYNAKSKEQLKKTIKKKKIYCAADVGGVLYVGTEGATLNSVDVENEVATSVVAGHTKEIWALATHPTEPYVCVGCDDKQLRVWNYDTKKLVFSKKSKHGYRTADFNRTGTELAVGCTDGSLVVIDMKDPTGDFIFEKKICKEEISAVAFSKDGNKICVGSWDQHIRILNKKNKYKMKTLKGHTSSVTHICMSEDGKYLQSNSKDVEILYWDVVNSKRIDSDMLPPTSELIWDRWNCILGWPVQGLFHNAGDATDVNCCEVSGDNSLDDEKGMKVVASGDDTGNVTLYKYPVLEQKPKFAAFAAHSAHVTNVRFTEDDKYLFSAGGGDLAVFQWEVVNA